MADNTVTINDHGLRRRMAQYPREYDRAVNRTMEASLYVMQEHVPPYPPQPTTTTYRRSGMLGRSLGVSMQGGKVGRSDVFQVRKVSGYHEGRFGTALNYAEFVIGDSGRQAAHMSHWWQLSQVPARAKGKLMDVWNAMARALARFLDGKGAI